MRLSSALSVSVPATLVTAQSCVNGAHVIVARASGERPGFGILGTVKDAILARIPNSDAVAVTYPAQITDPPYATSVGEGVGNMTQLIEEYGNACPGRKMVLMGYSQGAQVVADSLLGNANFIFPESDGINPKYIPDIAAIVLMGDPTNIHNQTFLVGNSTQDGFFPRDNWEKWTSLGLVNRTVSYCDAFDTYCDRGTNRTIGSRVHTGYVGEYGSAAVSFVVAKFDAAEGTSTNGTMTTTTMTGSQPTYTGAASTSGAPSHIVMVAGSLVCALMSAILL